MTDDDRTPYLKDVLADLKAIKGLMNDGRPLEALCHVNDSINSIEEEIEDD